MLTHELILEVLDAISNYGFAKAILEFGAGIVFHILNHVGLIGCLIENVLNGNIQLF